MAVTLRIGIFLALPFVCLLQSCSDRSPVDPGFIISDQDRAYGRQAHPQLLAELGGSYQGAEANYVTAVGQRIATAAGLDGQCKFTLVNSPVVNAFAVPGCYIYVTRGMVAIVTSEAELASVLGHELGHIVSRHAQRQERQSIWRNIGVIAISATGSERLTRLAGQAAHYFGLRHSRGQEYEADDLGAQYLLSAGYDVYAAADMLAALQRQETFMVATRGRGNARSAPEWALSHPLTEHRVNQARVAAEKTGLEDDALPEDAARYFAKVDGLLYGDDPKQGFVIGRRFSHPVMRIMFEAPPGFTLSNSPKAIKLSGPNGLSGEFGGAPMGDKTLQNYARTLAGQALGNAKPKTTTITASKVNGLPTVFMQIQVPVRDDTVPLAIAVYDGGDGLAYHFIIVSPPGVARSAAVSALFQSFRRLSETEVTALQPRFVRTVRVTETDTSATLIGRMADPAPKALFELLNGRSDEQPLQPGALAKIVTYLGKN